MSTVANSNFRRSSLAPFLRPPPSALRPPPSALRPPPSALRPPPSALRPPPSALRQSSSVSKSPSPSFSGLVCLISTAFALFSTFGSLGHACGLPGVWHYRFRQSHHTCWLLTLSTPLWLQVASRALIWDVIANSIPAPAVTPGPQERPRAPPRAPRIARSIGK